MLGTCLAPSLDYLRVNYPAMTAPSATGQSGKGELKSQDCQRMFTFSTDYQLVIQKIRFGVLFEQRSRSRTIASGLRRAAIVRPIPPRARQKHGPPSPRNKWGARR